MEGSPGWNITLDIAAVLGTVLWPVASLVNLLLKVAALWFNRQVTLDRVGASWDTIGAEHNAHRMAS